ncbi:hypothetical protein P5G60_25625 [Paenibacillus jamilae]|nr:hypothetical protein [Paenibacillus jamilae]
MKSFKIRIIAKFNTKNELFIPGEVHEARRISYNLMDFKTPFQIVSGKKSGEEVPFKYAVVVPDEPQPTQQQFDELAKQNGELLVKLEIAEDDLRKAQEDIELLRAMNEDLERSKKALLQTIEREVDEQLNTEKLLQRIRELETIAQGRDEMIKFLRAEIEGLRNPVEVTRDVAKAIDWCRWNGVDNDEIVRNLATGINGPIMNVLRSYVHEGGNGNNLLCALLNGYTAVSEKDEAAAMLEGVTTIVETWSHSPASEDGVKNLAEQICDFIREREAADEAVTI